MGKYTLTWSNVQVEYNLRPYSPIVKTRGFTGVLSKYLEGATILEATLQQLAAWKPTRMTKLLRAEMLAVLGWLSNRLGRLARAKAVLQEAQTLIEHLNRPPSIGSAPDPRAALGVNALVQGGYASAMAYAEQVRQTSEAYHHPWDRRLANYVLAGATLALGDYAAAQRYAETAFAIAQTVGDRWFMAYCLVALGDIAQALGDDGRAQRHYQTSYQLRQEFGDPEGMALALSHLGGLALQRQEYAQAQHYYQESLHLYRDVNDKGGVARVLHGLGRLACVQQQWSVAQQYLWQALALAAEIQFSSLLLMILVTIADTLIQNYQPERGLALLHFTQRHPTSPQATRTQAQQLLDHYQRAASASFDPADAPFPGELDGVVASLIEQ